MRCDAQVQLLASAASENAACIVCFPLCRYPKDSWEMLLGYDQDRFMGGRAGAALVKQIQVAAALEKEM